jgi:Ferritin-like domain
MIRRPHRDAGDLQLSERELYAMTGELEGLHRDTFPAAARTLNNVGADLARAHGDRSTRRRTFLLGVGGVAVLGGAAACSSGSGSSSSNPPARGAPGSGDGRDARDSRYSGDLRVVALAAALENLLVVVYRGALTMAVENKIGNVPAAVASFAQTAMAQHQDHSDAWNGVLKRAGKPTISGTPLTLARSQLAKLGQATSVKDVATLALSLENAAAQTYTFAAADVSDPGAIMTAAVIQPVEAMHAAILSYLLGKYPVPDAYIGTARAVQPSALTA